MNYKRKIQVQARSESMNKWISIIEKATGLSAVGSKPTERMRDLIKQLRKSMVNDHDFEQSLNAVIEATFEQGVQSGFGRALARFNDGSIRTQKVRNETAWDLLSSSNHYTITESIPTVSGSTEKTKVSIKLADHGFNPES